MPVACPYRGHFENRTLQHVYPSCKGYVFDWPTTPGRKPLTMGIGTALAFIAIGAIIAFAFHFHVSGIDIHMVGWILIFGGDRDAAHHPLLYTRPRRRRQVVGVVEEDPAYVAAPTIRPSYARAA